MAKQNFTVGDETRQIVSFGIPIMAGNLLMQLYNYVDSIIVGRHIGEEALAAVGAASPVVFMLISLVIGISIGSTILISQRYGARDARGVRIAADSLHLFLIIASILLTFVGITFSEDILRLISLPEEVIPYATEYLNIYLLGLIFMFIFYSLSAILRGVGDSKTPLVFLVLSSVVNIILDIVMVIYLDMGVEGAAWASVISQAVAVTFAISYTNRKNKIVAVNFLKLRYDRKVFLQEIKLGMPAGVQQMMVSIGMLSIFSVVNGFGTDVIAAYAAAVRIESLIFVLPMTISVALTSFVGQNYGAAKFDRIDRGIKGTLRVTLIMGFTILILLSALGRPLMQMFTTNEEIIHIGCNYLLVLALAFPIYSSMFIYMGSMRGMGNTIAPMLITLLTLWIIRVPMANILSSYISELGIWVSAPISWTGGLVASYILFHRLRRKLQSKL